MKKTTILITIMVPATGPLTKEGQSLVVKAFREVVPKEWRLKVERLGSVVDRLEYYVDIEVKL